MKRKILKIIVIALIFWIIFLVGERCYWGITGFLYPDMWRQLENSYRQMSTNYLVKKLYSFSFETAEVAENVLAERKSNEAVPHILRFLKSPMRYKRHSAMYALAKIGDKRAIHPLLKIIKKGRHHTDYLLAMKTLSYLHYDEIYPDVLTMAEDNFHASWVVSMLESFPDKPQTIPTLKKIAETDLEGYIREKAKNAIKHIESLQKNSEEAAIKVSVRFSGGHKAAQ